MHHGREEKGRGRWFDEQLLVLWTDDKIYVFSETIRCLTLRNLSKGV
jgi:hypothetical protein